MTRRSLFRMFGGAAAAYVCPLPTVAAAPVTTIAFNGAPSIAATSALTNEMLDRIYAQLRAATATAWTERHRRAYQEIAEQS